MAIDWTLPREGRYRYVRVSYQTRRELEELTTIEPRGSITRNLNTALKEQGSLQCVALPSLGDDLIRIYYEAEDVEGGSETVALATMHAVKPAGRYTSASETATLTLMSALLTLQQAKLKESLTIPADSNAIDEAVSICQSLGLPVVATASSKTLSSNASWDAGDTYLQVVNWLCAFAGYWSAMVDGWGRVVLVPYADPAQRRPVWTFEDGVTCTYLPDVTVESDAYDVPNVCILTCSNPQKALVGSYTNSDPASPYSTVSRGREIALYEKVDDAVDEADLIARAEQRLMLATITTERLEIEHAYAPVSIGDVVEFAWVKHGLRMRASIQAQTIALTPAALTKTTMKRIWT